MNRPKLLLPLIVLVICAGCSKEDKPDTPTIVTISDLLPKDGEISGWSRQSGPDAGWTVIGADALREKIDGGYDVYDRHGFVEAAMQKFAGTVNGAPNIGLDVYVYNQSTQAQADALFDDPDKAFGNLVTPKNPPSSKTQISRSVIYEMRFTKSKYYVYVSIDSNDDKAQDVIELIANNVAAKIK